MVGSMKSTIHCVFSAAWMFAHASWAAADQTAPEALAPKQSQVRVHMHSLGIGYHTILFGTESSDRYVLHGPALVYDYFIGSRWGFMMRASVYSLVSGKMSGPSGEFVGELGSLYDESRSGVDGMVLAGRRTLIRDRLTVIAGAGPHVQAFSLHGTRYSPVEDASLGLGGLGKIDFELNEWLSVSGHISIGFDLVDLVAHQNAAQWLVPIATGFSLAGRH
jgi:hypothetical protein